MCREKAIITTEIGTKVGSPLRVQGKELLSCSTVTQIRITPACAGKSVIAADGMTYGEDHPCVCREKWHFADLLSGLLGSPLRVQGKADIRRENAYNNRITPACAGKSHSLFIPVYRTQDHPCVCREKCNSKFITLDY